MHELEHRAAQIALRERAAVLRMHAARFDEADAAEAEERLRAKVAEIKAGQPGAVAPVAPDPFVPPVVEPEVAEVIEPDPVAPELVEPEPIAVVSGSRIQRRCPSSARPASFM